MFYIELRLSFFLLNLFDFIIDSHSISHLLDGFVFDEFVKIGRDMGMLCEVLLIQRGLATLVDSQVLGSVSSPLDLLDDG